jgi:hypothetical protein
MKKSASVKHKTSKSNISLPPDLEVELRKRAKIDKISLSCILQEASKFYLKTKTFEELQQKLSLKAHLLGIMDENDVDNFVHKSKK